MRCSNEYQDATVRPHVSRQREEEKSPFCRVPSAAEGGEGYTLERGRKLPFAPFGGRPPPLLSLRNITDAAAAVFKRGLLLLLLDRDLAAEAFGGMAASLFPSQLL